MKQIGWLGEMIQREAIPPAERNETQEEWCRQRGVAVSTYSYHARKKENQRQVVNIWLSQAVIGGNEVLAKLKANALEGKEKSIEMYLKFVLELKEKMDITSDEKPIGILTHALHPHNSDKEDNTDEEESAGSAGGNECEQDNQHTAVPDTSGTGG